MKAIKEQIDEQPKIIKLFSINYARDLFNTIYLDNKFILPIYFKTITIS